MDAPDGSAGKQFRCPSCGTVQPVGMPPAPAKPAAAVAGTDPAGVKTIEPIAAHSPVASAAPPPAAEAGSATPATRTQPAVAHQGEMDLQPLDLAEEEKPSRDTAPFKEAIELIPAGARPLASKSEKDKQQAQVNAEQTAVKLEKQAKHIVFSRILDDLPSAEMPVAPVPEEGDVLEHKQAGWTILILGMLGILAGVAVGLTFFDSHKLAAVYIGGAAGWAAGFATAFMIVLNSDKSEDRRIRCPICHNLHPSDTQTCSWCGSALSNVTIHPLAADCLAAGSFGLSNTLSILWMALLAVAMTFLFSGTFHLVTLQGEHLGQWTYVMAGACVVVGIVTLGFLMQFFLSATSQTLTHSRTAPDMPPVFTLANLIVVGQIIAVSALYIAPILSLPLLPLGLLRLASPKLGHPLDIRGIFRIAWRNPKEFAILWLMMLLWAAGLGLSLAIIVMVSSPVDSLLPQAPPGSASEAILSIVLWSVAMAALAIATCIFGLAIFRCIGQFGRYHVALQASQSNIRKS